jgi:hypothetical protein
MAKQLNFFTDPCVCGSGKILKDCCLAQRVDTKPKGRRTGLSNPKCYARALSDCSPKISREHFFSESILELWDEAGLATVIGVPAINGGAPTELNIRGIRPKVLCKRHNNCLSGLDSLALKFFEFLLERTPQEQFLLINGYELERWFLKVMCGMVAAGFVSNARGEQLIDWSPPSAWLEILYGNSYVSDDCGLTFLTNIKATAQNGRLQLQTMFPQPDGEFSGISVILDQFTFIYTMQHFPPSHHTRHRPAVFQMSKGGRIREVHTGWRNETLVGLRVTDEPKQPGQSDGLGTTASAGGSRMASRTIDQEGCLVTNNPEQKFDSRPQSAQQVQIPVIPKSVMKTAREIAAHPPEHLYRTPDRTVGIRADKLTENDIAQFIAAIQKADEADRERLLRFMLTTMKNLTEHRQWAVDQLIKVGEIMETFYRQIEFPQPD